MISNGRENVKLSPADRELISNVLLSRQDLINRYLDPRRDVDKECGHPLTEQLDAQFYKELYERGVGERVVEVFPVESWQTTPEIYETEDPECTTLFEKCWKELATQLRASSLKTWHNEEQGSPVWEYLRRLDILSGIGSFGILLLGFDDGKPLDQPVDGVIETYCNDESITSYGTDGEYDRFPQNPASGLSPSANAEAMVYSGDQQAAEDTEEDYEAPKAAKPTSTEGMKGDQPSDGEFENSPQQSADMQKPCWSPSTNLLYMRVFDESLVQIARFEINPNSPRYGMPVMYTITLNDPTEAHGSIGYTTNTVNVHWTRVIHVADNRGSSEIFGKPRMRPVLNHVLDLNKLYGGSAEMYWRGAFPGLAIETQPQLGADVEIDKEGVRGQMASYMNGLQRFLALQGMTAKSLAPQVVDPGSQVEVHLTAICILLRVPKRIFMGSERGELSSAQDSVTWNKRIESRRNIHITPHIVAPFINRLIMTGTLPKPCKYYVKWEQIESMNEQEKSSLATAKTQAMTQYVSGGIDALMTPLDFMTHVLEYTDDEARSILKNAEEAQAAASPPPQFDEQGNFIPPEEQNPPPGEPPAPGQPPQSGTDGGQPPQSPENPNAHGMGALAQRRKEKAQQQAMQFQKMKEAQTQNFDPNQGQIFNSFGAMMGGGNCGTGAGGFQPGNTCASGGSKESASTRSPAERESLILGVHRVAAGIARKNARSQEQFDENYQQAMMAITKVVDRYDPSKGPFDTLASVAAYRAIKNLQRTKNRRISERVQPSSDDPNEQNFTERVSSIKPPSKKALKGETIRRVRTALSLLPDAEAKAIKMHLADKTYLEIAQELKLAQDQSPAAQTVYGQRIVKRSQEKVASILRSMESSFDPMSLLETITENYKPDQKRADDGRWVDEGGSSDKKPDDDSEENLLIKGKAAQITAGATLGLSSTMAGGWAGAEVGGAIGTLIAPGVGTAVGGFVGGVVGGTAAALASDTVSEKIGGKTARDASFYAGWAATPAELAVKGGLKAGAKLVGKEITSETVSQAMKSAGKRTLARAKNMESGIKSAMKRKPSTLG